VDSIRSIKPNVDYVAVVYQTVSNFGHLPPFPPPLLPLTFLVNFIAKPSERQTDKQGTTGTKCLPESLTETPNPKQATQGTPN
jgi:hypothetical protein